MDIGAISPSVTPTQSASGMPPLSDAGSVLAGSVEVTDDDGPFMDGYELDLSEAAMAAE